jgi:hypothetical protein
MDLANDNGAQASWICDFGKLAPPVHYRNMNLEFDSHVPFAQLSTAHRFFYWISATVAIGLLRSWPPTTEEIGADIIRIWDEQKFAPADVLDFSRMADRLKPHLAKYAAEDRASIPEPEARRRRRAKN